MTYLFYFEEKIHRKNLNRAEAIPLLFPRLLSQLLEHLDFLAKPYFECLPVCEAIFKVEKWQSVTGAPPLPLRDPVEDQPTSSEPLVPLVPIDLVGPSTSTTPMETIPISPRDFLTIMTAVSTFSATYAYFATTHAALAEQMARTEAILTQTNVILAQNNAILV